MDVPVQPRPLCLGEDVRWWHGRGGGGGGNPAAGVEGEQTCEGRVEAWEGRGGEEREGEELGREKNQERKLEGVRDKDNI